MKIIIQSETKDNSTSDVIRWLKSINHNVTIVLLLDNYEIHNISLSLDNSGGNVISINNEEIDSEKASFWYRRGSFRFQKCRLRSKEITTLVKSTQNNVTSELLRYLSSDSSFLNHVNKFSDNYLTKLNMLSKAKCFGLQIPNTLVCNNKSELKHFLDENEEVINKPIGNPIGNTVIENEKIYIDSPVTLITIDNIHQLPEKFYFSVFQKHIKKIIEIRSFFIHGNFYSMAIFSQENEKTKLDFRNYDRSNPNRLCPYQLPFEIRKKLTKLMDSLNLNCGSFDIIYNRDGYFFLEVNPIGQFQWLSRHCNYYIEKQIAEILIKNNFYGE